EVPRIQPPFKLRTPRRPFRIQHRIPRGIPIPPLHDHVLPEYSLKRKPESQSGPPRVFVARIALPPIPPVAQLLEGMASQLLQSRLKSLATLIRTIEQISPQPGMASTCR